MDFGWSSSRYNHSNVDAENKDKEDRQSTTSSESEPADGKGLASLSVPELRTRLNAIGLRTVGKKNDLVECLLHPERETPAQIKNGIAHCCLTADYILRAGLNWVNIGEKRQKVKETTSITRFKAFYGVEPRTIKDAYDSFIDLYNEDDTSLKDFLMLVEWLKKCEFVCCISRCAQHIHPVL